MKIESNGAFINLSRYGGQDEDKTTITVKLGSIPLDTAPVAAVNEDHTPPKSIPYKIWERLTLKEQRQLMEHLVGHQNQIRKALMSKTVTVLLEISSHTQVDFVDPKLAQAMHDAISKMLTLLKSAGYPKPIKSAKSNQVNSALVVPLKNGAEHQSAVL